jgi:hypothetical protein
MANPISLAVKMFTLARADATLQGFLMGPQTFRWFPTQLVKGAIYQGSCVVYRQISDVIQYAQSGPINLDGVMMQIECHDRDSQVAQALARYLVYGFFPSANFTVDNQFTSPPSVAPPAPNFKLSQQNGLNFEVQPQAAWVEILTMRLTNNVNI